MHFDIFMHPEMNKDMRAAQTLLWSCVCALYSAESPITFHISTTRYQMKRVLQDTYWVKN